MTPRGEAEGRRRAGARSGRRVQRQGLSVVSAPGVPDGPSEQDGETRRPIKQRRRLFAGGLDAAALYGSRSQIGEQAVTMTSLS